MDFLLKKIEQILRYQRKWKKWQKVVASLACVVVFITTYALILPAITMDRDEAQSQGGISWEEVQEAEETVASADAQGADQDGILSAGQANLEAESDMEEEYVSDAYEENSSDNYESDTAATEEQAGTDAAGEENAVEEGSLNPEEASERPAATFDEVAGDVTVHVEAPEGAFPVGTTMKVEPVADEQVMDAVQNAVEDSVTKVSAVDIIFLDASGNEIEPAAEIKVSMSSTVMENVEQPVIVHVDEEGVGETVESEQVDGAVVFESDRFSVYVMVETITTKYITAEGETYTITVTYGPEAEIPDGAVLEVSELENVNKEYTSYVEQAAKALAEGEEIPFVNAARLFDISILADGKKIEPKVPVEVKIEYANPESLNETSEVGAVHFKESFLKNETEVMDVNIQREDGRVDGVTFTAKSFSIYAVVIIDKEAGTFVFEDEKNKITITYTKEAGIPIGTELTVRDIVENDEYDELWDKTIEKMNEGVEWINHDEPDPRIGLSDAAFFDISLNYGGKEFEPRVPLGVKIEFKNGGIVLPSEEKAKIVHFAENGTEIIDEVHTEIVNETSSEDAPERQWIISFEYQQEGFSIVGPVTTGERGEGIISGLPIKLKAANTKDSSIAASKTLTDVDDDGVYELALNVTGASESSISTNVNKSNVVIVLDTSGSMGVNYTYSPYTYSAGTYSDNTTYYRNNSGDTVWYWPGGYYSYYYQRAGWYYGSRGQFNTRYNGTVYTRQTRMEAAIDATDDLIDALLSNNKDETTPDGVSLRDIVEISLVTFSGSGYANGPTSINDAQIRLEKSTSASDLKNIIDNISNPNTGGTNWEAALKKAKTAADAYSSQIDETTSVIFITDGMPTFYLANTDGLWSGYGGTGQDTNTNANKTSTRNSWTYASDDARALVMSGYQFFGIFAFGTNTVRFDNDGNRTDADYLRALVNYAYSGEGSYANTAVTQYVRDYFFNATDTTKLSKAFQAIIDRINNTVGYGGVEYDDGVTLGVTNTSVAIDGKAYNDSFRYKVTDSSGNIIYSVKIVDGSATFDIPGKGTHIDNSCEEVTTVIDPEDISKNIVSQVYSVDVDGVTYKMSPASINPTTGMVEWDLAGLGILQNGYTYTVAFDVWPNQYSYDIVADLNNGLKTKDQIKSEVIEAKVDEGMSQEDAETFWQRIEDALVGPDENNQYAVLTNYQQKVDYYTVNSEEDDQGNTTITYSQKHTKDVEFEGDIALTSKPLPMEKIWNSSLRPDQIGNLLYEDYPTNSRSKKYQVTLHVWKADTAKGLQNLIDQHAGTPDTASEYDYIEKKLGWSEEKSAYDWDDVISIAPGTMVSLQTAVDMGVDTTSENNKKNIVSFDGQQYYIIEKGHYYTVTEDNIDWHYELETEIYHPMLVNGYLKNVTFITDDEGSITGVKEIKDMTQVAAANSKTAELDITKVINDKTGKMTEAQKGDETFTYKITLTVPAKADLSHTTLYEYAPYFEGAGNTVPQLNGYQAGEDSKVLGLTSQDVGSSGTPDVGRFDGTRAWWTVSYDGGGATLDEMFTNDNGVIVNSDGSKTNSIYATIHSDEVLRFTNLPAGTQYKIEEVYVNKYQAHPSRDANANLGNEAPNSNIAESGYSVTIETKNGSPSESDNSVSGTIDKLNQRYYNQFTNTLNDTAVVDLSVTKHLQGYEWTGDRYYVKLAASANNTPLPRITTRYLTAASGKNDVTFNFGSVHLKPGTYTYTLTETANDYTESYAGETVNGVIYDTVKTIKVVVATDLTVTIHEDSSEGVTYNSETNIINTKLTNKVIPLSIYKIGDADVNNKLEGVQFKLYSDASFTTQVVKDARNNDIGTAGIITTGTDGTALIGVLNEGTYYLVETNLGNNGGYNKLADAVEIYVGDTIHYKQNAYSPSEQYSSVSSADDLVKTNGGMFINYATDGTTISGYTFTINNNRGKELPMTGGTGTVPYTLSGIALIMASALMYGFRMRRRERRSN